MVAIASLVASPLGPPDEPAVLLVEQVVVQLELGLLLVLLLAPLAQGLGDAQGVRHLEPAGRAGEGRRGQAQDAQVAQDIRAPLPRTLPTPHIATVLALHKEPRIREHRSITQRTLH